MVHNKRPRLSIGALDLHRPFLRFWVLRGPRDRGRGPYVQIKGACITLEPISELPRFVSAHKMGEQNFFNVTFGAGAWAGQVAGKLPEKE